MNIAIIGAGSVGLSYAALLSESSEVTLVCRTDEQASKINDEGIIYNGKKSFVTATTRIPFAADLGVVAVGTDSTSKLFAQMKNSKIPAYIMAQNGIRNSINASRHIEATFFDGVISTGYRRENLNTSILTSTEEKPLIIGRWDQNIQRTAQEIAYQLKDAGLSVDAPNDFDKRIFRKYAINNSLNGLCTIQEKKVGDLTSITERRMMLALARETYEFAEEAGVEFDVIKEFEYLTNILPEVISHFHNHEPSMLYHVKHAKQTEIGEFNGLLAYYGGFVINSSVAHAVMYLESSGNPNLGLSLVNSLSSVGFEGIEELIQESNRDLDEYGELALRNIELMSGYVF